MLKIAVIGSAQTVMGFKALGLEACPASDADEARKALKRLTAEGSEYAIIYIEENLYVQLSTEIDKFKDSPLPAIILIPGKDGLRPWALGIECCCGACSWNQYLRRLRSITI